jgi:NADH-quinone oxidoreductase subunit L
VVTAPLVLLAFPSVVTGFLTIEPMLFGEFLKDAIFVDNDKHPAMAQLAHEFHEVFHGAAGMALHGLSAAPFWLSLAGIVAAWYMYLINPALPARIKSMFQPVYALLENKYYMDWINENIIARAARALGTGLWKGGDQGLIEGVFVNGSARFVGWFAGVVRWVQSGYIYHYAFAMLLGVIALMSYFVSWPMLSDWLRK